MNPLSKMTRRMAYKFATRGIVSKAAEDLSSGGWHILEGTDVIESSDIWKRYTDAQKASIYKTCSVVYSCIKKIGSSVPQAELRMAKGYQDDIEYIDSHPALDLMRHPNPTMSYDDYVLLQTVHYMTIGESYVLAVPNKAGTKIVQLIPLPKSWFTPVRDYDNNVVSYDVGNVASSKVNVPIDFVRTSIIPDPTNPYVGMGPLQAGLRDYQIDIERQDYLIEMLTNLAVPGPIFKKKAKWESGQKKAAKQLWKDLFGKGHRGDIAFLSGEGAAIDFLAPLKDLDWPGLTALGETRLCSIFGVSPLLIDLRSGLDKSTYSNTEQADRKFYRQTMVSYWKFLAAAWTRTLLQDQDQKTGLRFVFDWSKVEQMQEDKGELSTRLIGEWNSGLITRNEARVSLGYEDDPVRGEVYKMKFTDLEIPVTQRQIEAPKEPAIDEDKRRVSWDEKPLTKQ